MPVIDINLEQFSFLNFLSSIERIGPIKTRNILSKYRNLNELRKADFYSLVEIEGISENLAKKILNKVTDYAEINEESEKYYNFIYNSDINLIPFWSTSFPSQLKNIYDPPLLLHTIGNFMPQDEFSIAVVGTRNPTSYGRIQTEKIVSELSDAGITIVSGLARGIDTIAHNTVVKNNGRTLAILGTGLDVIYPSENKKLYDEIYRHGMLVSEFKLGTKPDAENFPRRNRIISGLSLGTVIIESKETGGAMITANLTFDQNREVYAVPGNISSPQSFGPNNLIKQNKAKIITSAKDIIDDLGLRMDIPEYAKQVPVNINMFEEKILDSLDSNPIHIDALAGRVGMSTSDSLVHLLNLEFSGLIKQLPGKMFVKI